MLADTYEIEKQAKINWTNDPALRDEFAGNFESYVAYLKADAAGLIKFAGRRSGDSTSA